jgi:hypothetical protein
VDIVKLDEIAIGRRAAAGLDLVADVARSPARAPASTGGYTISGSPGQHG